jgi:hypothetical protein
LRIEHSRKHGPFDHRYPPIRHKPVPASLWHLGEERLDWQGFLARFFPDSTRHDFGALAAYESYRNDIDGLPADGVPAPAFGSASTGAQAVGVHTTAPADTERAEGDASAGRAPRPRRRERHAAAKSVLSQIGPGYSTSTSGVGPTTDSSR